MIAENGDDRCFEATNDLFEGVEVQLAVADKVAGEDDEVWMLCVRDCSGGALDRHRCDTAHVQIGEVSHPEVIDLIDVSGWAGEST
jgi:hypothetical protein